MSKTFKWIVVVLVLVGLLATAYVMMLNRGLISEDVTLLRKPRRQRIEMPPPPPERVPPYSMMESGVFQIAVNRIIRGKPPRHVYFATLTASNPYPYDVWFILPYYGDHSIPTNFAATSKRWYTPHIGHKNFQWTSDTSTGECRQVTICGEYRALILPPQSQIRSNSIEIDAWSTFSNMEVFVARNLRVDDHADFNDWSPYRTVIWPTDVIAPEDPGDWQGGTSRWWKPGRSFTYRDNLTFTNIVPDIIERRRIILQGVQ